LQVAVIQYDLEAIVEAALDLFRLDVQAVYGPHGNAFIKSTSEREGRNPDAVRDEMYQLTKHMMTRAKRHLRQIAKKEFEPLIRAAITATVGLLPALVVDRMPDFFPPPVRQDRRKDPIDLLRRAIRQRLNVGAPKMPPPLLGTAQELLRVVAVGEELFEGVKRNDDETLPLAEVRIRRALSDERELRAALDVLKAVSRRTIVGKDVQKKNLAFQFAANLLGLNVSTRTLRRKYDAAKRAADRMTRKA
jgi:hypothetical protein